MHELILASQSPRRKNILKERGYKFCTFPIEVSEILNKNLNLFAQIADCARQKAEAALADSKLLKDKDILLLTADTVVAHEGRVLLKPKNKAEAISTLLQLSGKSHKVVTGYCLVDVQIKRFIMGHSISEVEFRKLNEEEVRAYVETGEPMDKAGSYGIQGEARKFVKEYKGSFNNIVGLPIEDIEKIIEENGWDIEKES